MNLNLEERDGCFEEVKAGRCCLGISYMLFKERESGEMRMRKRMRMRMEVGEVCCDGGVGMEELA